MNKKYFNVPVSLKDNNSRIIDGVMQYDTANLFNIKIYDGAESFDFSGYTLIVLSVLKPDGTEYVDSDGENLDVIDASEGRISMTLPAGLVALSGMHFCTISIYANGVKLTTARFNYYVRKALTSGELVKSQDEYPILQKLLTQLTLISDAEQMRNEAEGLRVTAENERVSVTAGIVAQVQALASQAMNYAKAAQDWYTLLVAYAGDLTNVDLTGIATKQDVTAAISAIDCGLFTGSSAKVIQMRRGSAENMPSLSAGECGFDIDSGLLYIGNGTENVLINGSPFIAQATAPDNVNKLWIDTANGNAIKYYDGTMWTGTATATFG